MTLTLVRDLQTQLQHFEKQLVEVKDGKKTTSDAASQSPPETGKLCGCK